MHEKQVDQLREAFREIARRPPVVASAIRCDYHDRVMRLCARWTILSFVIIQRAEDILNRWKRELGGDEVAYRNHVYRVVHFCSRFREGDANDREKVVIAACFHDLGIWTSRTFDYIPPSIALAMTYLREEGLELWSVEIESMIAQHHKLTSHRDPLVESFRRSDFTDVSLGLVKFGLPRSYVREVKAQFPNAGFHKRLVQLAGGWWVRHPFRPLPVLKW